MNEICFFNFISTDCPKLGLFYRRLNYIIINMSKMPFFIHPSQSAIGIITKQSLFSSLAIII